MVVESESYELTLFFSHIYVVQDILTSVYLFFPFFLRYEEPTATFYLLCLASLFEVLNTASSFLMEYQVVITSYYSYARLQ